MTPSGERGPEDEGETEETETAPEDSEETNAHSQNIIGHTVIYTDAHTG